MTTTNRGQAMSRTQAVTAKHAKSIRTRIAILIDLGDEGFCEAAEMSDQDLVDRWSSLLDLELSYLRSLGC
jgi:hypothetical protein